MTLRGARVDLQQPDMVVGLVIEELGIEGPVAIFELLHDLADRVDHAVLYFKRQYRWIFVARERRAVRLADAVDDAVDHDVPMVDIAFQGALRTANRRFRDEGLGHDSKLFGHLGGPQEPAERLDQLRRLLPARLHDFLELALVVDRKSEVGAE